MQPPIDTLADDPAVAAILAHWAQHAERVVDDALAIQAIPAPTFEEQARAQHIERRFHALGLADVAQDAVGNVYARTPGSSPERPAVLVSAHLDTVFSPPVVLEATRGRQGARAYGPGLGDNSLGLAALTALAGQLQAQGHVPPADIWWVATVGEEGLGNLRGMRAAAARLRERIGVGLVVEGIGLGWVYHAGLGVRRLRVTVRGPGGHSWLNPPPPSAIHHLLRIGAALVEEIGLPSVPRSAFNIGLIEGGTSVNTRAAQASLTIDLRSVDAETLTRLEAQAQAIIARFSDSPELEMATEVVGDRPSAALARHHPLVRAALATLKQLGWKESHAAAGSTDANALLAARIPAICIGLTTGKGVHTTDEVIDTEPVITGMRQLTLLTLLAARHVEEWQAWEPGLTRNTR